MKFSVVSALSALIAMASALTPADISQAPSGNPISRPGLNELVPVGVPYTITWDPTTEGKVSIILLRGPGENVVPIDTLADGVNNTGTFIWTPSTSLENDVTHYGLQIIVEGTGQYQYSTQFGIKNDGPPTSPSSSSSSSSKPPTSSSASYASSSSKASLVPITTYTTVYCSSVAPTGTAPTAKPTTIPTSLKVTPTPTPSSPPTFKGAAGHNAASLGGVVIALAAVLAL